ncbi:MAG: nitroreductase family protein, partial [Frankiaceae bacterium]|nr:nitroreductase family protein [Frankiaceae bacterium]
MVELACADIDRASADALLRTTRAVRRRLDLTRQVEPRLVLECIDIAQQAPTGANGQRWHFMVVTDPRKRVRIAE